MGIGLSLPFLIPPRSQSVKPTNLAPMPFSQSPPSCTCSIVCVKTRPSASKSKMKRPVKALCGSTPLPRQSVLAMAPGPERPWSPCVLRSSHHRTTSCSGMAPGRRGRKVRGSEVIRSARISSLTLPIMGTRFHAIGDVHSAAL